MTLICYLTAGAVNLFWLILGDRLSLPVQMAIPILTVLNKCDKLAYEPLDLGRNSVLISAQTGYGIDALLQSICRLLPATQQRLTLLLPYAQGGLENHIVETGGKIFSRDYTEEGILLDALVDSKELHRVAEFVQRDPKG